MSASSILQELLDDLPTGHHERPGLMRAIELLRADVVPEEAHAVAEALEARGLVLGEEERLVIRQALSATPKER